MRGIEGMGPGIIACLVSYNAIVLGTRNSELDICIDFFCLASLGYVCIRIACSTYKYISELVLA